MPSGEVTDPRSKDGFLKSGYLKRYDLYDADELPSRLPVLNAQNLKKGDAVIFDVLQATIETDGNTYFIPVAFIQDKNNISKQDWDKEWDDAFEKADKLINDPVKKEDVKNKITEDLKKQKT